MPAGSKPGERRGGRKKGVPNKSNAEREARIAAEGITPLEYMLKVMRDETEDTKRRDQMAAAAARYVHPTMASVEATVDVSDHEAALEKLK